MAGEDSKETQRGVSESLRDAVERTYAATVESAAGTRGRAQELLDEVARRGQEAREVVSQRGNEARDALAQRGHDAQEASAGIAARAVEAVEGMRLVTREELRVVEERVAELSRRVSKLESKPKVEG